MTLLKTLIGIKERRKTTDYDKVRVTSNGAFYMNSEDIFDNKIESLKLIKNLRSAVDKYNSAKSNIKADK